MGVHPLKNQMYIPELTGWSAVQRRFGIRRPEAKFVLCLVAEMDGQHIALALFSDDGVKFAAAIALRTEGDACETVKRPMSACRWQDVPGRLAEISDVAADHFHEIRAWIDHVRPPEVAEIISVDGPDAQVLRLLRDALGLQGAPLKEAAAQSNLLRVSRAPLHALAYLADRFSGVTIHTKAHDARA